MQRSSIRTAVCTVFRNVYLLQTALFCVFLQKVEIFLKNIFYVFLNWKRSCIKTFLVSVSVAVWLKKKASHIKIMYLCKNPCVFDLYWVTVGQTRFRELTSIVTSVRLSADLNTTRQTVLNKIRKKYSV